LNVPPTTWMFQLDLSLMQNKAIQQNCKPLQSRW
jgi:hypothetical protein